MEGKMENVRILENDGHNTPSFHTFRDLMQAAAYVARGAEEVESVLATLEEGGEYQDENFVTWSVTDELYEHDHTQDGLVELCEACGERAARGEERPECECECHDNPDEEE
jgi:hypothetical protein